MLLQLDLGCKRIPHQATRHAVISKRCVASAGRQGMAGPCGEVTGPGSPTSATLRLGRSRMIVLTHSPLCRGLLALGVLCLAACETTGPTRGLTSPGGEGRHEVAEALWAELSPAAMPAELSAAEMRLGELFEAPFSAESCGRHRAALESSLDRLPIDLALWSVARDCARMLGDGAWQRRSQQRIDQLTAYALRGEYGTRQWLPAPVLQPADVDVLLAETGRELVWVRFLAYDSIRHLLLEASVREADGRQQRMYFDLLPALVALNRDQWGVEFTGPRRGLVLSYLESQAIHGDPLALAGFLNLDLEAGELAAVPARRALERAWGAGLPGAGLSLLELCLAEPDAVCQEEMEREVLDALTAAGIAEAWAMQAAWLMIRQGRELDDEAVRAAMDQAGRLMGTGSAQSYLGDALIAASLDDDSPRQDQAMRLWRLAADAGRPEAQLRLSQRLLTADSETARREALRYLDRAAEQGVPVAMHFRAVRSGALERAGLRWLIGAAERGWPDAQMLLSVKTMLDEGPAAAEYWLTEAALGGHSGAMRILARRHLAGELADPSLTSAEGWLVSAVMMEDELAESWLLALYLIHPELLPEDGESPWDILDRAVEELGVEEGLAVADVLLDVDGFNKDPGIGLAVLEHMAEQGLAAASLALAQRLDQGRGADADFEQARRWYQRAFEQGAPEAYFDLANSLLLDHDDLDGARHHLRLAADAGSDWAANDLAFLLCTGQHGMSLAPEEGLDLAEALFERLETPHPYMYSTLAACQAAAGHFDEALANHRIALARTEDAQPEDTAVLDAMRERLALYERGIAYRYRAEPVGP